MHHHPHHRHWIVALITGLAALTQPSYAEPGISSSTILLGQSVALSGAQSENASQYHKGLQIYLDQVNAKGGVHGRKVELITLDDGYDPKRTEQNTQQLIGEKATFALVGFSGTGSALAALPIAEKAQVPFIAPLSGADPLHKTKNPVLFNLRAGYGEEIAKIIEQQTTVGIKSIAIAYQNDGFGKSVLQNFEAVMARYNLKPAAVVAIDPANIEASAKAAAATLAKAAPAALIMGTSGQVSPAVIRETIRSGSRPQFFGLSVISMSVLRKELGNDAIGIIVAQVVPSPWSQKFQIVRQYREALALRKEEPHYNSLEGYMLGRVVVEALKRSGPNPTRAAFLNSFTELRDFDLGSFTVDYSNGRRTGSSYVDLSILASNGQFVQ
jgi:ABC-type branched-subunit amino acid transport system substrate-binding protein